MKNLYRRIFVSEHDFIISPEMYIGIKYIEDTLLKTIDSFEAVYISGTNLLTMIPAVADEYYFFNFIRVYEETDTSLSSFTMTFLSSANIIIASPLVALTSADADRYQKNYGVFNVSLKGFSASSTFDACTVSGIKVNTS